MATLDFSDIATPKLRLHWTAFSGKGHFCPVLAEVGIAEVESQK